jgi:hypothetical protein
MKLGKRALIGGTAVAATLALMPGAAFANTNWTASSSYGTASASMTGAKGRLELSLGAMDTKCDGKSAGTLAYVNAGGERRQTATVAAFDGCHSGTTEWFYYDISELGGQTSGYVTMYACRVRHILGAENYTSCSAGVSRTFTIS